MIYGKAVAFSGVDSVENLAYLSKRDAYENEKQFFNNTIKNAASNIEVKRVEKFTK